MRTERPSGFGLFCSRLLLVPPTVSISSIVTPDVLNRTCFGILICGYPGDLLGVSRGAVVGLVTLRAGLF